MANPEVAPRVSPLNPGTATAADQARASIAALKQDSAFVTRVNKNEPAALAELEGYQRTAVGLPPLAPAITSGRPTAPASPPTAGASRPTASGTASDSARAQIAELKTDAAFRERLLSGDRAANAQLLELEKTAVSYKAQPPPEPGAQPPHGREQGRSDKTGEMLDPKQRELHQHLFAAPDDPSGYTIRHDHQLSAEEKTEEQSARSWLHSAGVSVADGNDLAQLALKVGPRLAGMDDAQRAAFRERTEVRMRNAWGDDAPQRLAAAVRLVAAIEQRRPGLKAWLEETGLGDSWEFVALAAKAARRRYGRGKA